MSSGGRFAKPAACHEKGSNMKYSFVLAGFLFSISQPVALLSQELPLERFGIRQKSGSGIPSSFTGDFSPNLDGIGALDAPEVNSARPGLMPDGTIDPEKYVLGPGDELTVTVWGSREKRISVTVDPEGRVLLPIKGNLAVGGKSLSDARDTLTSHFQNVYRNAKVEIALTNVREFTTYVSGMVEKPAEFHANGFTRVSTIIKAAGGVSTKGRARGILLISQKGDTTIVDIPNFVNTGDLTTNPYLKSGDRVVVPPRRKVIQINGHVGFPGVYDFLPGDKLGSVIELAGGMLNGADSSRILLTRISGAGAQLADTMLSFPDDRHYSLFPDDRILVSEIPDFRERRSVEIRGEVQYPGIYPIEKNRTRLSEVVEKAGGFTAEAFLKGSTILRKEFSSPGDREFERVRNTPIEYLTPIERSFLKSKQTEEEGRISIDFSELFGENQKLYDVVLRDRDIIEIARRSTSVHVMGAVVSPGLIAHRAGADLNFYVKQAGGYNTRAKKHRVTIIKAGTGIWLNPHEVERIETGDAVYVPEKEYRDGVQVLKDTLVILGSIATLIITTLTVREAVTN